jgi:opacity protein-like surface antigen
MPIARVAPRARYDRGMRLPALALLTVACIAVVARPAAADLTAFLGIASTPSNRAVTGAAVGFGLLVLGFEFEYAAGGEDHADAVPALTTAMGNVLLQMPFPVGGMQFYATAGAGGVRETLADQRETSIGLNSGGGVKITVSGPVRIRVDYRVFSLRGDALHPTVQRIYTGLNLAF